ncbi:unnamed protein product, partial [Vitis vinifera]
MPPFATCLSPKVLTHFSSENLLKGCLPKVLEGLRRECRTWRGRPLRLVVWARGVVPRRCGGKDVSIENMHQGFTHVFESTFESVEGIAEYVSHPAHVEFANLFLPHLEKVIVFDYKPITVHL